jgi:hypothetical protein
MTYVPNTIEIPTHEADLKHHGVGFEGKVRIINAAVARWRENVERKKVRRKKEKEGGEIFRELSHAE